MKLAAFLFLGSGLPLLSTQVGIIFYLGIALLLHLTLLVAVAFAVGVLVSISIGKPISSVNEFLHLRNASFGKVTDSFIFLLKQFRDLV
jgi:hypothetical protein